jgi:glycine C-acetyltransferase
MTFAPERYSLADFFVSDLDSTDPTVPPADFSEWRRHTEWATRLYEPALHGPAQPRTSLEVGGRPRPVINLSSYNYLGLATHPEVVDAAKRALDEFGVGACGSPMLSGMTRLHRELEERLASYLGRESVMLFNSGFSGALGSLSGLLRKGDVAVVDSKVHVSLMDGVKLAQARLVPFEHNRAAALDEALQAHDGKRRLIVLEGVYSMDGDIAALPDLLDVAESHGVPVFIDEAHSILTCGTSGRGVVEHFGVESRVALQYATFSKAFAGLGGFVAGPRETIGYLRCYANSYGFSCALPPATVAALLAALGVARREPGLRERLWENCQYFREQVRGLGIDTGDSTTYVVPLIVGPDRAALYRIGNEMRDRGLFLAPVDYPSVPEDQVRFRASITAAHTRRDLDEALNIIADTMRPGR